MLQEFSSKEAISCARLIDKNAANPGTPPNPPIQPNPAVPKNPGIGLMQNPSEKMLFTKVVTEKIGSGKSFAERVRAEKPEKILSEVLTPNTKNEPTKISTSEK